MRNRTNRIALALGVVALGGAAVLWALPDRSGSRSDLGLLTTLPIYWGEAADLGEVLAGDAGRHWVREELESGYMIRPLDTLEELAGAGEDTSLDALILAQPRPLSAAENVALDEWVRSGGRALIFADPMLTGESRFSIGDRRRPQDVVLLSPILARWGLTLRFDDGQPAEGRTISEAGLALPVVLAGTLASDPSLSTAAGTCRSRLEGVIADCTVGRGKAVVVADAAILQGAGDSAQRAALDRLLSLAFR